jgi:AcrR family transcriptional regulator
MRVRDENKNDAIFSATIDLLNEIGFADSSMSKIAKRANVSSSTIYVYFENKDDMLKKTYLFVKGKLFDSLSNIIDEGMPVRETIAAMMRRMLEHLLENKAYFLFSEQFDNSPYIERLCLKDQVGRFMLMYYDYINEAKAKGIIKNIDTSLLIAYCYYPIAFLAKESYSCGKQLTEELVAQAIELSWQAIKA